MQIDNLGIIRGRKVFWKKDYSVWITVSDSDGKNVSAGLNFYTAPAEKFPVFKVNFIFRLMSAKSISF